MACIVGSLTIGGVSCVSSPHTFCIMLINHLRTNIHNAGTPMWPRVECNNRRYQCTFSTTVVHTEPLTVTFNSDLIHHWTCPLPQHNLLNISTVSEGGSALHGPHILHSTIFVLHLVTEACVFVTKTGQWNKSRTSITYSSYKYLHTLTLQFLSHIPHFTQTMTHCPQVTIIWTSPPLTALQLIQYIYMHTYTVHLSPSYAFDTTKDLLSLRNILRPCGQLTPETCKEKQLLSAKGLIGISELSFWSEGFFYNWSQWYVKQLQNIFRQSSPLIQYLKEQKMCHIKHQH